MKVNSDHILHSDCIHSIPGKNNEEHLKTLESVNKIIFENKLKLKLQKCVFIQPEVMFLSYRVNKDGVFPLHEKVDFKNAESPKSVTELKSYIGSINYRLWITFTVICQNSSKILEPLQTFKETCKVDIGREEQAFQQSKSHLNSSNLLFHFDPKKPLIIIACDASFYV